MVANAMPWSAALLPRQSHFTPSLQSRSGGLSLNGSEQVVFSDAGRWQAKVIVSLRGEASNLALRAFLAQMGGRAGTVLVPKWDRFRPADINGRPLSQVHAAGYDDGRPQDGNGFNFDLSGFGQPSIAAATVVANAPLGATRIAIISDGSEGPRPGHYFGLGQRLYLISNVWKLDEEAPIQVEFWPRLRAPAASGELVLLDRPVCLMRFSSDDVGGDMFNRRGSGSVTFDFVEAI